MDQISRLKALRDEALQRIEEAKRAIEEGTDGRMVASLDVLIFELEAPVTVEPTKVEVVEAPEPEYVPVASEVPEVESFEPIVPEAEEEPVYAVEEPVEYGPLSEVEVESVPLAPELADENVYVAEEPHGEYAPVAEEEEDSYAEDPAPVVEVAVEEYAYAAEEVIEDPAPVAEEAVEEYVYAAEEVIVEPAPAAEEAVEEHVYAAEEVIVEPEPIVEDAVEEYVYAAEEVIEEPAPVAEEMVEEYVYAAEEVIEKPAPVAEEAVEEYAYAAEEVIEEPAPVAEEAVEEYFYAAESQVEEFGPAELPSEEIEPVSGAAEESEFPEYQELINPIAAVINARFAAIGELPVEEIDPVPELQVEEIEEVTVDPDDQAHPIEYPSPRPGTSPISAAPLSELPPLFSSSATRSERPSLVGIQDEPRHSGDGA